MIKRNKIHLSIIAMSLLSFGVLSIGSLKTANASHVNQQPQTIKLNHVKHLYTNHTHNQHNYKNNYGLRYNINKHHNHMNAMNYVHIKVHHNHKRMTKANDDFTAPRNPADEEQGVKVNFKATPINYKSLDHQSHHDWFREDLSNKDFNARQTIVSRESGGHWRILSYGHRCIGYFQLDPAYLGYKNGHINLGHKHQVKVADNYVKNRYGSWVNALHFWNINHWY